MSYPTKPCFVGSFEGWDDKALKHPIMQYLSNFNTDFCETKVAHSGPHTKWFTQDFEFQTQKPLSAFIQDTEDGYNGMVYGNLYTNFVEPGEKKYLDKKGMNWELRVNSESLLPYLREGF
ncbi:hypothetical protein ACKAV7_006987 [Fusarium commune]